MNAPDKAVAFEALMKDAPCQQYGYAEGGSQIPSLKAEQQPY